MPQPKKMWVYAPKKPTPPKIPEALKREVETKANALVESVLKPLHVKEPEPDPQLNYIESLYTKWYRSYFYFCAHYIVAGPYAHDAILRAQIRPPDIHRRRALQPGSHAPHGGVDGDPPRSDAGRMPREHPG